MPIMWTFSIFTYFIRPFVKITHIFIITIVNYLIKKIISVLDPRPTESKRVMTTQNNN